MKHLSWLIPLFLLASCGSPESTPEETTPQLPAVHINTDNELTHTEKRLSEVVFLNMRDTLFYDNVAKVKTRGEAHGALKFEKKSYTIRLGQKQEMMGMPANRDWILNSSYIDKTMMRHKLSYDFYRKMSPLNIAPQTDYVDVYFNGDYRGVYLLTEKLDGKRLEIDKEDSAAVVFKAPKIFLSMEENLKRTDSTFNFHDQRFPELEKDDRTQSMDDLQYFIEYSTDQQFTDSVTGIASYFDLDQVIDWHLYLVFSNNSTGNVKNFYLYRQKTGEPYRLALWDCDRGYGRDGDNALNLDRFLHVDRNVMIRRLCSLNAFNYNMRLKQRYNKLRNQGLFYEDHFQAEIDVMEAQLQPHVERNFERWPVDGPYYLDENDFDQEVQLMRDWINTRFKRIEEYLQTLK